MRFKVTPALAVYGVVIFLFWAALYAYVPILPVHAAGLRGGTLGSTGLVISMYGLTQLILRIPLGIFSDRLNARRSFVVAGIGLSLMAALGLAFTSSVGGAAFFRGLSGTSAATWVVLTTLFAGLFAAQDAVRATSLAVFLSVLGQMVASLSGGQVAQAFGNQAAFFLAAGFALAAMPFLPFLKQPETLRAQPGAVPRSRFRLSSYLLLVSLAAAVVQFVTYATTFGYLPIRADLMGASRAQLGQLTAVMQLAYMLTSLAVSFAVQRGEKLVALAGIGLLGAASFGILLVQAVPGLFVISVMQGVGQGLSYPVLMGLAIKPVANERRATAMGFFQAIYALGMFAGPAISGWISEAAGLEAVFVTSGWVALVALPVLLVGLRRAEER